jgi:hypothetical protein
MATLILTSAVASLGLSGWGLFAASLAATAIGTFIDNRLFATHQNTEGPRLQEIAVSNSTEGSPIKRLYGRCRIGGTLIWATHFKETKTEEEVGGGKGGGGGQTVTSYTYSISFAVAFCEGGPCTELGRVWFDGSLVDISKFNWRWYEGTSTQSPDSLIQQVEGADKVPAFRGTAYLVFEDLPLADFGNRIPQVTAEINHQVAVNDPDVMENILQGISLIPSSGEFIYSNVVTTKSDGEGNSQAENSHYKKNVTDIEISLDQMNCALPNIETVNLVVGWFGDDLRAGNCQFKPRVEVANKSNSVPWRVNGIVRSGATLVSVDSQGRPIYGGTPSDHSIVQAIQELKSRGHKVCFYPFTLMDIPSGNTKPNPYSANGAGVGQAAFPWRGRITCHPAPGFAGTVDKTATASTQVDSLFGSATTGNFSVSGTQVDWTGGSDWGIRRMILHYALLCKAAGGVDYFCVGTEMVGVTSIRSSASNYPAVTKYASLINDVKAIGGVATEVGYAADWSEYHSHRPGDGTNDVYFNMDPIWQAADFIGIDNYMPLSDWRDGILHTDYDGVNGPRKIYDRNYLTSNIEGGEYYDWFYANESNRDNQIRTAITDGAYGKPWVFRQKDIRNWWNNQHFNRPAGVQSGSPTGWTPGSKRVIFTEFGCPAVDKGTNQPNVFVDPKSSESEYPHYSTGQRDDVIQRTYIEVFVKYWRDNGGSMVAHEDMWAWTWDARPYPQFPYLNEVWSDGANWTLGHWLNGRAGSVTLGALVTEFMSLVGLENDVDVSELVGQNTIVPGYVVDNIMSPREMLTSLFSAFMFDGYESGGKLKFSLRIDTVFNNIDINDLVTEKGNPGGFSITRQQETELIAAARVDFMDPENSYQSASVSGTKIVGESQNVARVQFPVVLDQKYARSLADQIVQESWAAREVGEFLFPISKMKFEPGDGLTFTIGSRFFSTRINGVEDGLNRKIEFSTHEPSIYGGMAFSGRPPISTAPNVYGKSIVEFLDIPLLTGSESSPWAPRVVAYQDPFPPSVDIYIKDPVTSGLTLINQIENRSVFARTMTALEPASPWVINYGQTLRVNISNPIFQPTSNTEDAIYSGLNAIAVKNDNGLWEIIQFVNATLVSGTTYDLNGLIRGQLGTEADMATISIDARVVFLQTSILVPLGITNSQKTFTLTYRYGPSADDPSEDTYQDQTLTFRAVGLMPYAPTSLQAVETNPDGRIQISWARRTRFGGDDWDSTVEPPLNEEYEKYDLEILNGASVVRSLAGLTSTDYTYSAADQVTDFGSLQTSVHVRIYQLSSSIGRGHAADETLIVDAVAP